MNLFPHLSAPLARACWSEGRRYIGAEIRNNADRVRFQTFAARFNTLADMFMHNVGNMLADISPTCRTRHFMSVF